MFKGEDGIAQQCSYLVLIIASCEKNALPFNLKAVIINGKNYLNLLQKDRNFLRLNERSKVPWKECDNNIYVICNHNWQKILQDDFDFSLVPYGKITFPLNILGESSHAITAVKDDSLLFFSQKNEISIILEINGKCWEYGISRKDFYEKAINHLAFFAEASF